MAASEDGSETRLGCVRVCASTRLRRHPEPRVPSENSPCLNPPPASPTQVPPQHLAPRPLGDHPRSPLAGTSRCPARTRAGQCIGKAQREGGLGLRAHPGLRARRRRGRSAARLRRERGSSEIRPGISASYLNVLFPYLSFITLFNTSLPARARLISLCLHFVISALLNISNT